MRLCPSRQRREWVRSWMLNAPLCSWCISQVALRIVSPSTLLEEKHANRSFCVSQNVLRVNSEGEYCLVLFLVKFVDVIQQPFLHGLSLSVSFGVPIWGFSTDISECNYFRSSDHCIYFLHMPSFTLTFLSSVSPFPVRVGLCCLLPGFKITKC